MKKQIIFARLLAGALVGASCAVSAMDVTFEIAMKDGRFRSEQAALERKDGAVTFRLARTAIPKTQLMKKRSNDWELDARFCLDNKVCDVIVENLGEII